MGHAFCMLLEHLDPHTLPVHGGDATTVTVTIDLDRLINQVGSATLDAGIDGRTLISAADTRRLACTAKILPAVLGGKGEILDLGRAQRLYSTPQRKALALRDQHCRGEGCTIPARWWLSRFEFVAGGDGRAGRPGSAGGRAVLVEAS